MQSYSLMNAITYYLFLHFQRKQSTGTHARTQYHQPFTSSLTSGLWKHIGAHPHQKCIISHLSNVLMERHAPYQGFKRGINQNVLWRNGSMLHTVVSQDRPITMWWRWSRYFFCLLQCVPICLSGLIKWSPTLDWLLPSSWTGCFWASSSHKILHTIQESTLQAHVRKSCENSADPCTISTPGWYTAAIPPCNVLQANAKEAWA